MFEGPDAAAVRGIFTFSVNAKTFAKNSSIMQALSGDCVQFL